MKDNDLFILQI